jgi:hypothetical protein
MLRRGKTFTCVMAAHAIVNVLILTLVVLPGPAQSTQCSKTDSGLCSKLNDSPCGKGGCNNANCNNKQQRRKRPVGPVVKATARRGRETGGVTSLAASGRGAGIEGRRVRRPAREPADA